MTRERFWNTLGGLALIAPLAAPAWAGEKAGQVRIYKTDDIVQQATVQEQAPEQSKPATTESKDAPAEPVAEENGNGESVGFLQEYLRCGPLGSWLECNQVKVAGWLAQGFTWNPDSPDNRFNFPVTFNDRSNEYQMNQLYLYMERAVNTEGCCWDFGGRIDVLYGTDYYFTTSTGWETNPDGSQNWNSEDGPRFQFGPARLYGIAVPQLYGEVFAPVGNGVSVKLGHFYTPFGYEVVPATGNFFYSHAYTMQYFEPFTHWGAIAASNLTDSVKLQAGITMGWDVLDDPTDKASFLTQVTWTSCDQNTTVSYGVHVGEEFGIVVENGRFYHNFLITHKITDNLTYAMNHDLIWQNDGSLDTTGSVDDAECYSIAQYLIYEINKCLSAGARFEWARDDDHLRVIPPAAGLFNGSNFFEFTLGLNWKPFENVRVRPELRWDWSNFPSEIGGVGIYDDFSDKNQFTAAFDVILAF